MFRRTLLRAAVAVTASFALCSGAALAQTPVRIRVQTAVPSASVYFELLKHMADRVDKMSNGRVKMEMLPDGAVVGAFEILDAVDKGVIEGGYAWTHYWSGKNPAAGLFSNPMAGAGVGLDQLSHVAWIFQGGGYDLYRKLYRDVLKVNVEPIFVQPMGPDPLGWFKRPIKDVADFKTMKYRAPPGITGEIFKEMGISAVALPGVKSCRPRSAGPSMRRSGSGRPMTAISACTPSGRTTTSRGCINRPISARSSLTRPGGTSSRLTCRRFSGPRRLRR